MTKHLCDRCGREIPDQTRALVTVLCDVDVDGDGEPTDRWDLCPSCTTALGLWVLSCPKPHPPAKPRKR